MIGKGGRKMKLAKNINSILEQDYYYVTKLDPISLSNIKYSTILSRRRYERALELIDIEKTDISICFINCNLFIFIFLV